MAIQTVEADAAGGLIARGFAEPNATVRLYLNDANVADARTKADGRWSLTIKNGMIPGGYLMRADEISPGQAAVVASANTPFDYPEAAPSASPAAIIAGSSSAEPSSPPSPADPVIELGPDQAGRDGPYLVGAQPQLLWRPDALPGDLSGQQVGNPQPQPHLSGTGGRCAEV